MLKLFLGHSSVAFKSAGRRKFTEFVTDHIFRHVDRQKRPTVVHVDGKTNEVRGDSRPAGPSIQSFTRIIPLGFHNPVMKLGDYKKSFFKR
jgi:hypothetical protein